MTDLTAELMQFKPLLFASNKVEERFFNKVRERASGCWEWIGAKQYGYGKFCFEGWPHQAHRVSFLWFFGPDVLGDLHIDHLCGNRACVHPYHLEAATQAENNRRAVAVRESCRRDRT